MSRPKTRFALPFFSLLLFASVLPIPAFGGQSESPVACIEGGAIPVNYGDHAVCSIGTPTDIDSFLFNGSSGDLVRVIVSSPTFVFDPRLEIRDPNGLVIVDDSCSGGANGCAFRSEQELSLSGQYTLSVSHQGSSATGAYTIQIELIPPFLAAALLYDLAVSDDVGPVTDMDFLVFEGEAGTDVRLTLSSPTFVFDPRLEIWDPSGARIWNESCSGGANGCSFSTDQSLTTSGTYLIAVSHVGSAQSGHYEVSLQCLFGPCPVPGPPVPTCDITLSGGMFTDGDTVNVSSWRVGNPSDEFITVELKAWLEGPDFGPLSVLNVGSDGSVALPAGLDTDLGSFPFLPVTSQLALGTWEFSCSMVHPATGRPQTLDRNTFEIQ